MTGMFYPCFSHRFGFSLPEFIFPVSGANLANSNTGNDKRGGARTAWYGVLQLGQLEMARMELR